MNLGRIFLPYGMKKNVNGEWILFNKQENPVGCTSPYTLDSNKLPVRLKIKSLGEIKLRKLSHNENSIVRDSKGQICRVYFYQNDSDRLSTVYVEKLSILDGLQLN
jgi:hypothetical protein